MIDWVSIVDRTRFIRTPAAWGNPAQVIAAVAAQYETDFWADQQYRPEVWVEKDALISVLQVACDPLLVPYFSCRGYTSDSEVWAAAQRLLKWQAAGQIPIIIHLGDHDPSGIDMSRDILDRLCLFVGGPVEVRCIALNMDQVRRFDPPPNPAKQTDSRFSGYLREHGGSSWELDALNPTTLTELIRGQVGDLIDRFAWDEAKDRHDEGRRLLQAASNRWGAITGGL